MLTLPIRTAVTRHGEHAQSGASTPCGLLLFSSSLRCLVAPPCRTYEKVCAIRCVQTTDYMTADWYHMPYEILGRISNRIINEVRGINRVTYDISSKPPATIEWE